MSGDEQYLERVASGGGATLYEVKGAYQGRVRRWVATTPESRRIVNEPEILGVELSTGLATAVTRVLPLLPEKELLLSVAQERICVGHFLRGGLNFGIREAIYHAFGLVRHSSCFMSSQRRRVGGRWVVREDMYRKLRIPKGAILLFGDVVATGITVENGLEVIRQHLATIGSSVRRIIFFTLGCHKLETVLEAFDEVLRESFPVFEGSTAVYLEGKFRLVDSQTPVRIGIPGTDLLKRNALVAPELARSQYDNLAYPLERCVIYDAGSRAFDVPTYVEDVRSFWEQVLELALDGLTLKEALRERWPEPWLDDRQAFLRYAEARWRGVEDAAVADDWEAVQRRWTPAFRDRSRQAESLAILARKRLDGLPRPPE